jgi:hypothetical protein
MGTVIQLLERPSERADASIHTGQVNNALLSPKATSEQIFRAARTCETLCRSIVSLQASRKPLDDICGLIGDPATRETRHIKWN